VPISREMIDACIHCRRRSLPPSLPPPPSPRLIPTYSARII
jgi:hypothetical protein